VRVGFDPFLELAKEVVEAEKKVDPVEEQDKGLKSNEPAT